MKWIKSAAIASVETTTTSWGGCCCWPMSVRKRVWVVVKPMVLVGRLITSSADHREGTEPYVQHHTLHVLDDCVFVPQAGGIDQEVVCAGARNV